METGKAREDRQTSNAGQADDETSDPDRTRGNGIVEVASDQRRQRARESPAKPIDAHVTAAQICGSDISHIFAGGGHNDQFAERQNDHAQPETLKAVHHRHGANAERVDQHSDGGHWQSFITARDMRHRVLYEHAH